MDDNRLFPLQQLIAAHQEVRECNGYSQQFGLTLSEPEITELVACREEALRASVLSLCDDRKITDNWVREYMTSFADSLLPRLDAALDVGDVSHLFIGSWE